MASRSLVPSALQVELSCPLQNKFYLVLDSDLKSFGLHEGAWLCLDGLMLPGFPLSTVEEMLWMLGVGLGISWGCDSHPGRGWGAWLKGKQGAVVGLG